MHFNDTCITTIIEQLTNLNKRAKSSEINSRELRPEESHHNFELRKHEQTLNTHNLNDFLKIKYMNYGSIKQQMALRCGIYSFDDNCFR